MPPFLIQLLLAVTFAVISYMLRPRPPAPKPPEMQELQTPTAEAGRPIPKVWGTRTVKAPNMLFYGDKEQRVREVSA